MNLVFAVDEGHTRLHRAHQRPRQYPHARLRDSARIRPRRRRRLQSRARQSGRAAPEESHVFQEREDHRASRARRPIVSFSMSTSRNSRPANSRSPAGIRPPTDSSARSALPSEICSAAACSERSPYSTASIRAALKLSFVEPYFLGYRVALGLDLFYKQQNPTSYVSYQTQTVGFGTRLGFALARRPRPAAALFALPAEGRRCRPI